jgi:hypothetical protein
LNEEIIHLPPLRSIVPNNGILQQHKQSESQHQEGTVEVDAAVAMMQLASRRQQQQQQQEEYSI